MRIVGKTGLLYNKIRQNPKEAEKLLIIAGAGIIFGCR